MKNDLRIVTRYSQRAREYQYNDVPLCGRRAIAGGWWRLAEIVLSLKLRISSIFLGVNCVRLRHEVNKKEEIISTYFLAGAKCIAWLIFAHHARCFPICRAAKFACRRAHRAHECSGNNDGPAISFRFTSTDIKKIFLLDGKFPPTTYDIYASMFVSPIDSGMAVVGWRFGDVARSCAHVNSMLHIWKMHKI